MNLACISREISVIWEYRLDVRGILDYLGLPESKEKMNYLLYKAVYI